MSTHTTERSSPTAFCPRGPVEVAVVVVTHNSADDLPALLRSLREEARDARMRVVVADNSSEDGSLAIATAHADVLAIPTGGNLGYAGGINVASGHVGEAEAILVLNPDVQVHRGAVSALLGRLRSDPRIGVVVPRILDEAGHTSCSLRREPTLLRAVGDALIGRHWPGRPAALSEHVRDLATYEAPATTDWATGAALLIASDVAAQVGPWDERYFLYSEETDFFHRVRQAGWTICYDPTALVTHRGGGSGVSDELVALTLVNKVRYMDKHRPRSSGIYSAVMMVGEQLRRRDPSHDQARWALQDRSRWGALPRAVLDPTSPDTAPHATVIIPAHNEEAVIAATLAPLAERAASGVLDVVVVCNGCTDRTADLARAVPGVTVLEIPTASKASALAAGDAVATRWPRIYLDADIVVSPLAVKDVVRRLDTGDVLAARPTSWVDTSEADWMVRAYYRARGRLPSLSKVLWGAGVYALTEDGHRRLGTFPAVTADDLHVDRLFGVAEKAVVDTVPVRVRSPRDPRALLTVLTRARRGAAEQEVDTARSSLRELVGTVRGPASASDALVYAALATLARWRGNASAHTGVTWERDETSRAAVAASAVASVDHVICTRFNLPTPGPESLVRAQHDWLVNRVALFERYTVPSMRRQTVRDFCWVVYLDPASPAWLRERLRPVVEEGLVTPRYRESVTWEDLAADAREITGARGDLLLTTNLDNDDAVAPDFVEQLQHLAVAHPGSALFLRTGLILHDHAVYLRHDPLNAFCSVSETWQHPVTTWRDWHTLLGEHLPVVSAEGAPGWLQVVHGQNVSNRVRGTRVCPTAHRARFPDLLDDVPTVDAAALVVERALKSPGRGVREAVRRAGKHLLLSTVGKEGLMSVRERVEGRR